MAIDLSLKLFFLLFFVKRVYSSEELQHRILYGNTAKIEDYPFYAGLDNCGAAVISDTWILTAAHCVEDIRSTRNKYVWVGGETFANSIKVPYNKVIIHEEYKKMEGLPYHDVAVIRLAKPLQFSKKIQPIKLPSSLETSSRVVFIGRGTDETGRISKSLKKLNIIRLTTDQCISLIPPQYQSFARYNLPLFEKMNICAKRDGDGPSICHFASLLADAIISSCNVCYVTTNLLTKSSISLAYVLFWYINYTTEFHQIYIVSGNIVRGGNTHYLTNSVFTHALKTLMGDSGSPLVNGNTLVGLASFIGRQCSQVRLGFYVNVATYVPWIKGVTGL